MNFATSSGIGAAADPAQVTWSRPSSSLRNPRIAASACLVGLLDLRRHRAADLLGLDPGEAGRHRVLDHLPVGGVGVGGELGGDAGLDLLPDPRDAEERRRVHLAERAEQLGRVADRVHVAADDLRAVEAEHPLGDVRERQVADRHLRVHQPGRLLGGDRLVEHVVVGEHDALRVPGRAGRVEDRRRRSPG